MEYIMFAGELTHITEAVSVLQCNGLTEDEIFRWLERKLGIGRFSQKKERIIGDGIRMR